MIKLHKGTQKARSSLGLVVTISGYNFPIIRIRQSDPLS